MCITYREETVLSVCHMQEIYRFHIPTIHPTSIFYFTPPQSHHTPLVFPIRWYLD